MEKQQRTQPATPVNGEQLLTPRAPPGHCTHSSAMRDLPPGHLLVRGSLMAPSLSLQGRCSRRPGFSVWTPVVPGAGQRQWEGEEVQAAVLSRRPPPWCRAQPRGWGGSGAAQCIAGWLQLWQALARCVPCVTRRRQGLSPGSLQGDGGKGRCVWRGATSRTHPRTRASHSQATGTTATL